MKKILLLSGMMTALSIHAQFSVTIQAPEGFKEQDAILYTLNGSKDIIVTKEQKKIMWTFKYPKAYSGMMKAYFPNTNNSVSFISENKNVSIKLDTDGSKVKDIVYLDDANILMSSIQELSQKKEVILPALSQIKEYYKDNTEFGKALKTEIGRLSGNDMADVSKFPFVSYNTNYNKYLSAQNKKVSQDDIINFIDKSSDMLETSSLLRPF
jgi:hypothetical protein